MRRNPLVLLCFLGVFARVAQGQTQTEAIEPVHITAGTVLTFYLQTRLHPANQNATDELPRGTILRVKMLDPINSGVDHDGSQFRGVVISSVVSGDEVIVHPEAEVRGILVLLRSRGHPNGFRYELMVTSVNDHGKSLNLTASLNSSFFDGGSQPAPPTKAGEK